MSRPSVHFGRFDAERAWEPVGHARLPALSAPLPDDAIGAMDELLVSLCDDGDHAVTRQPLLPEHVEHLVRIGVEAASALPATVASVATSHTLMPWAVTPETCRLVNELAAPSLPALDVVARVNSKLWSTALRQRLGLNGQSLAVHGVAALEAQSARLLAQSPRGIVVKEAFGVSGRGSLLVPSVRRLQRLISTLARDEARGAAVSFVLEPFVEKLFDFSTHLFIERDGSVALESIGGMDNHGFSYAASRSLSAPERRFIESTNHTILAKEIAENVRREGYFGPLCLDGMALRDGTIIPLVEINARGSLGRIHARIVRRNVTHGLHSYLTSFRLVADRAIPFGSLLTALDQAGVLANDHSSVGVEILSGRTLPFGGTTSATTEARAGRLFVNARYRHDEDLSRLLARCAATLSVLCYLSVDGVTAEQPQSAKPWDDRALGLMNRKIRSLSRTRRQLREDPAYAPEVPEEIGLQLTNRCNLRCEHCYQWNETGFHHHLPVVRQRDELDIEVISQLLAATREKRPKLFLWGGEPLVYREWDRLVSILEADPRWTVLCTNGIGLDKKIDSLLRISDNLVTLISLDGFADENDAIRGKGTFARIMESIGLLIDLQTRGVYRGEVSISTVLSSALIPRLYEFIEYVETLRINTLQLGFPWYIPPEMASRMDGYFHAQFGWLAAQNHTLLAGQTASWHGYQFRLAEQDIEPLKRAMQRIAARTWKIGVRFNPALKLDEVAGFVRGSDQPAQGRTRCTSVVTRINVLPDGRTTSCKQFPEMAFGSLTGEPDSLKRVWRGENAVRARSVFACGLTPVCSKCSQLYLHGL